MSKTRCCLIALIIVLAAILSIKAIEAKPKASKMSCKDKLELAYEAVDTCASDYCLETWEAILGYPPKTK